VVSAVVRLVLLILVACVALLIKVIAMVQLVACSAVVKMIPNAVPVKLRDAVLILAVTPVRTSWPLRLIITNNLSVAIVKLLLILIKS